MVKVTVEIHSNMHKGYRLVLFRTLRVTLRVILGHVHFFMSNFSEIVQHTAKVTVEHL